MPEPGLRVDVIGFLNPINTLFLLHHCSDRLWRVSCQREHWSFPLLWSSAGEDFLWVVTHSFQTSSFKTHC